MSHEDTGCEGVVLIGSGGSIEVDKLVTTQQHMSQVDPTGGWIQVIAAGGDHIQPCAVVQ